MNAIDTPQVYFRSLATRGAAIELPASPPGGGRGLPGGRLRPGHRRDAGYRPGRRRRRRVADVSLYVMTPEFGAASQLEKIDMLDLADVVAINKFDRRGAEDALRQVQPPVGPRPPSAARPAPRTSRSSAPSPPASTTTA